MPSRERIAYWAFEVSFGLAALYALWPLWQVAHPPIQDLPQHLAAVRVLADYGDPDLSFGQYFDTALMRTQYLAYYLLAILLSWPFGVMVANKLLISASILGTPYCMRALLRSMDRDERLALFVLPLTWNAHLILGFLNFIAAIPLALLGLYLAIKLRQHWSPLRALLLALVTVLCFYTHVVPFAFLGLGAALVGLGGEPLPTLKRWAPLVPGALAALVWTRMSPAGQSTVDAASGGAAGTEGAQAVFSPALRSLSEAPGWLTDILQNDLDGQLLVAFGLLLLGAAVLGKEENTKGPDAIWVHRSIVCLAPLAALGYFIAPVSYDWIWPINARFPLLALIFLIPALPAQRNWMGSVILSGVLAVSIMMHAGVGRAFQEFEDQEVGQLEEAIASMPQGARVAALVFDRASSHVRFSPFIHSAAWVQARNGGAVMFTFADFPQSPFVFKQGHRPPRVGPRWEWMPERVDPAADLAWYDYVLVRGGPGQIARQSQAFERIFHSPHWSVYRRIP